MARGIPHHVIRYFEAVPMFGSVSRAGIRALTQRPAPQPPEPSDRQ